MYNYNIDDCNFESTLNVVAMFQPEAAAMGRDSKSIYTERCEGSESLNPTLK